MMLGLNKKTKLVVTAVMASLIALPALANDQYTDRGRVLSVTPQTERVNVPRQECRTEYQRQSVQEEYRDGNRSYTGSILGGIAGGLLGSTIGKGSGRVAAAAVGAGIGAVAGDRISNRPNSVTTTRTVPVESCYQVDNWQTVNTGYLVTYEYNGRTYTTVTNTQPGDYIDVNVSVSPRSQVVTSSRYVETIQYNERDWDRGQHRHARRHHRDYY
jgi:uncharacterized protein YcfJ